MKYEPVIGDQSLFDGAPEDAEMASNSFTGQVWYKSVAGVVFFSSKHNSEHNHNWCECDFNNPGRKILAMRRIIAEPKRWTAEDKNAGRLPEVGSKAVSVHGFCVVDILAIRNGCVVACNSDVMDSRPCVFTIDNFLELYKPIETSEEKAARLREEWCIKALSSCSILSGMQKYELKRLGGYIEDIYDALLSGELESPSKMKGGEQ